MTSFFGRATAVAALSPIIIVTLLTIYFWGELPGIKICIVILVTSSYLAISHVLVKKIGLMKSMMIGLLAMILNFIILVA